jgi:hypothetical protein
MMAVPLAMPDTAPEAFTVAMVLLLVDHMPPSVGFVNTVALPWHTEGAPTMGATTGIASTLTTFVAVPAHEPAPETV